MSGSLENAPNGFEYGERRDPMSGSTLDKHEISDESSRKRPDVHT